MIFKPHRHAAIALCVTLMAAPVSAHYVSSNCSTSKLGGGTCQKHSHPHRDVAGMASTSSAPREAAMGMDGSSSTKAARIKVKKESCGFLKALFIGC